MNLLKERNELPGRVFHHRATFFGGGGRRVAAGAVRVEILHHPAELSGG